VGDRHPDPSGGGHGGQGRPRSDYAVGLEFRDLLVGEPVVPEERLRVLALAWDRCGFVEVRASVRQRDASPGDAVASWRPVADVGSSQVSPTLLTGQTAMSLRSMVSSYSSRGFSARVSATVSMTACLAASSSRNCRSIRSSLSTASQNSA